MTTHYWGDDDFDWKALNNAMEDIQEYVNKYSRCYFMCKEKYGSIRYEHVVVMERYLS